MTCGQPAAPAAAAPAGAYLPSGALRPASGGSGLPAFCLPASARSVPAEALLRFHASDVQSASDFHCSHLTSLSGCTAQFLCSTAFLLFPAQHAERWYKGTSPHKTGRRCPAEQPSMAPAGRSACITPSISLNQPQSSKHQSDGSSTSSRRCIVNAASLSGYVCMNLPETDRFLIGVLAFDSRMHRRASCPSV